MLYFIDVTLLALGICYYVTVFMFHMCHHNQRHNLWVWARISRITCSIVVSKLHFWLFALAGGLPHILCTYLTYHLYTLRIHTTIYIFGGPPAMSKTRPPTTMICSKSNCTTPRLIEGSSGSLWTKNRNLLPVSVHQNSLMALWTVWWTRSKLPISLLLRSLAIRQASGFTSFICQY